VFVLSAHWLAKPGGENVLGPLFVYLRAHVKQHDRGHTRKHSWHEQVLEARFKAGQRPGTGLGFSLGAVLATFAMGSCAFSGLSGFWKQSNYKQATKHELLGGYYLLLVAFWCKRTELRPAELLTQELLGW
jgi:hypothetical protein